ncbi:MAG TPA: hypothetical protein VI913_01605 [Candidatus Peribacteraceae bacterium]|nr:hypothetical protein [Candidatus Peribacteraceae bacterium]
MQKTFFVTLGILLLTGCTAEMRIAAAIERANYCETATDCVLVGSKCPFDCYIYANVDEAQRITELVNHYQSSCEYSCVQTFGVECVNSICKAITEQPPAMEKVGASTE